MRASEIIRAMQEIIDTHGDAEIMAEEWIDKEWGESTVAHITKIEHVGITPDWTLVGIDSPSVSSKLHAIRLERGD